MTAHHIATGNQSLIVGLHRLISKSQGLLSGYESLGGTMIQTSMIRPRSKQITPGLVCNTSTVNLLAPTG